MSPNGLSLSKAARIRLAILGLAVASFVAGAGVAYVAVFAPKLRLAVAGVEEPSLADTLGLDANQRAALAAVLDEGEARLRTLRDEVQASYRARLDAVARETDRAIADRVGLTAEQARRLEAWRAERPR